MGFPPKSMRGWRVSAWGYHGRAPHERLVADTARRAPSGDLEASGFVEFKNLHLERGTAKATCGGNLIGSYRRYRVARFRERACGYAGWR